MPELAVLHYTASGSAMSSAHYLVREDVDASAHVLIARDGRVIQLVPFNVQAWHAGKSCYEGRSDVNGFSVGIELQNAGELHKRGEKFYSWYNAEIRADEVYQHEQEGRVTYWHTYTDAQRATLKEILDLLYHEYGIRKVVGHSDITERKKDPGPAFAHGARI
ncbi:MAG: N-acetylmuramoyl-L-alanine amidase [Marinifilaceae bacterium]